MSKVQKLLQRLKSGNIKADELRTLLTQLGYILVRQNGSHEQWLHRGKQFPENCFTLATHSKELKPYQIKEAQRKLLKKDEK